MTKIVLCTMLAVGAAACVGYIAFRKRNSKVDVLESLDLNYIFNWIDEVMARIEIEKGATFKVFVLPNEDTQKLAKMKDKRSYAVVLQKELNDNKTIIEIKIFYALSLDRTLSDLECGKLLEIPIEL